MPTDDEILSVLTVWSERQNLSNEPADAAAIRQLRALFAQPEPDPGPVPMILTCPRCNGRHIDRGKFASLPHHTHSCQRCGITWRPAKVPTVGVQFLPGFRDGPELDTGSCPAEGAPVFGPAKDKESSDAD